MMKQRILPYLWMMAALMVWGHAHAQEKAIAGIHVLASARPESVIIRWAPTNPLVWSLGNRYGYRLIRYTVFKDNQLDTSAQVATRLLTAQPLKPQPLQAWESLVSQDKYAAIAAQAMYGDHFELTTPSDDQVSFLNQASQEDNRFGFSLMCADLSAPVAEAMALRWVDTAITPGERYVYKVSLYENPTTYPVDTGSYYIDPQAVVTLTPVRDLQVQPGDRAIQLSWESYYHKKIYVSYVVERSEDEGKTYGRRDDVPFINISQNTNSRRTYFLDSLTENLKVYYYRIKGITSFGETGPPSVPIQAVGIPSTQGVPAVIRSGVPAANGSVVLQWAYPENLAQHLKGFQVERGATHKGPFIPVHKQLLEPALRQFVDPQPQATNYYRIKAMGIDSMTTASMPFLVQPEDVVPPSAPTALAGWIDDQGIVYLHWQPNVESDISGYRVFRANQAVNGFIQVTPKEQVVNQYTDTINLHTLTRMIYYKIVAEDHHGNRSDYSTVLALPRPDKIPPASPVFIDVVTQDNTVSLTWSKSPSEDVESYELKRIHQDDTVLVQAFKGDVQSYKDQALSPGAYVYCIQVTDHAGLHSSPVATHVQVKPTYAELAPPPLKTQVDRTARCIKLSWRELVPQAEHVIVYRAEDDGPLRFYQTVTNGHTFLDKSLTIHTQYRYRLKWVLPDGQALPLSEPIVVNY